MRREGRIGREIGPVDMPSDREGLFVTTWFPLDF